MTIFSSSGMYMTENTPIPFDACKIAQTTVAIAGPNSDPFMPWALTMVFVSYTGTVWRWEDDDLGGGEIYRFELYLANDGWFAELTQDVHNVSGNYHQSRGHPSGNISCVDGEITFTSGGITFDGMRVELVTV